MRFVDVIDVEGFIKELQRTKVDERDDMDKSLNFKRPSQALGWINEPSADGVDAPNVAQMKETRTYNQNRYQMVMDIFYPDMALWHFIKCPLYENPRVKVANE